MRIPDGVSFEEALFVEPVNTCLKGIRALNLDEEHVVLVAGLGSVGLILQQLAIREGAQVIAADPLPGRRRIAERLGAARTVDPKTEDVHAACLALTEGRGADRAIVAAVGAGPVRDAIRATRPGAAILLFAQTHRGDEVAVDVGDLCIDEKRVVGSYSASVDLADEAAEVVFRREIDVRSLITHRIPLRDTPHALDARRHAHRRRAQGHRPRRVAPGPPAMRVAVLHGPGNLAIEDARRRRGRAPARCCSRWSARSRAARSGRRSRAAVTRRSAARRSRWATRASGASPPSGPASTGWRARRPGAPRQLGRLRDVRAVRPRAQPSSAPDMRWLTGFFADHLLVPARHVQTSLHRVPAGLAPGGRRARRQPRLRAQGPRGDAGPRRRDRARARHRAAGPALVLDVGRARARR